MPKKNEEAIAEQNVQQPETQQEQPQGDFLTTLKEKGTTVLTAKTREELAEMVNGIPAEVKYGAGAVGKNQETGEFTLRLDLIK